MTEIPTFEVGQKVAEYWTGGNTVQARVATVERITATQYVLDNGKRYRRPSLLQVGGGYGDRLRPVDDPLVVSALAEATLNRVGHRIDGTITRRGRSADPVAVLDEVIRLAIDAKRTIEALAATD